MVERIFFNAHHAPIGAFATFTLGCEGAKGGLGLELAGPADQNIFVGIEDATPGVFRTLPFYAAPERKPDNFDVEGNTAKRAEPVTVIPFRAEDISRDFQLASDAWTAGDLTFTIYSPVVSIPDPEVASHEEIQETIVPAVFVELTIDNRNGAAPRRGFFGFQGTDPYSAMRRLDDATRGALAGIAQGRHSAIASVDPAVSAIGFGLEHAMLAAEDRNNSFGLGAAGVLVVTAPPRRRTTFRFAVCFFRAGVVTTGLEASYLYTRYFANVEEVASFAAAHFDTYKNRAQLSNRWFDDAGLSDDQKLMLVHAIRSYYGSSQLLEENGKPIWVVNEGEYRMMNTFDLTVDHLFFELRMNPWTVRNVLDLFCSRYRYVDGVRLPGEAREYPGGISFTHDMGVANAFSPPGRSSYERGGISGCFSHMTHEQLVNWVLCVAAYHEKTHDDPWLSGRLALLEDCLTSLQNRDHPEPAQRDGVMSMDSSRTEGGAEITTYDSLDASLGQARGNLYLAVKCWAAYVALERLFSKRGRADLAEQARSQAARCARTIVASARPDGSLPAIIGENNASRIIPAIEGLVFPYAAGNQECLAPTGPYADLVRALERHLATALVPGVCLFSDGGWKISSTSDNSWLSKIYLCQFVARRILGLRWGDEGRRADAAHVGWLLDPESRYFAFSDQMVRGVARGSRYYPRGVTAILWLEEAGR